MELDDCLVKRHSVRKFSEKEIPPETLGLLIRAAITAPTAGNLQEWRFVAVTDSAQKDKIANACEEQLWMAQAGALIVVCTDDRDLEKFYGPSAKKYAVQDAAAAAENMLLKATDLGLGSCWVAACDEEQLKTVLALPGFVTPYVVVAVGYTEEKAVTKPTFKVEDLIHINQFGKKAVEYPEMGELIKRLVEKGKKAVRKIRHA
ncbi:nitroreductase family protein [Candidatus Woesearchaeota archaeon]|nr:nitroreductase family protein [Candidatus Woesearchaeota archaeon]